MAKNQYMRSSTHIILSIGDEQVPVTVFKEDRNNVRASLGKRGAILRMPFFITDVRQKQHLEWFGNWIGKKLKEKKHCFPGLQSKTYVDGQSITVGERIYILYIHYSEKKSHSARLAKDKVLLRLSSSASSSEKARIIPQLLSRVIAQDQLPAVEKRVDYWNDHFFKREIGAIRLKYNHSNWGSCSKSGNINLSTRILFTPSEVQDYVIVHELAHLIEFNHSKKFWDLVEEAMPKYKESIGWLKANGHLCDF